MVMRIVPSEQAPGHENDDDRDDPYKDHVLSWRHRIKTRDATAMMAYRRSAPTTMRFTGGLPVASQ
jgi:hypothetical protein